MARCLSVGIQLPEVERVVTWPELRDIAQAAEETGFDSIWVGDHLLYRDDDSTTGPWEAWSMLAALGAATERVQLGPLVAATAFHNPAMLAKKAATVDEISDGRLVVGLGAGWNQVEFDAYGLPFDHRASRFEEAFTIVRTLLTVGYIDFVGEYFTLRDCELVPPARPGGPPLMIGSQGRRVLRITMPFVDKWNGWYAWFGNTPTGARRMQSTVDSACRDVGRDPNTLTRTVTVLVQAPGGDGNVERVKRWEDPPALSGTYEQIAAGLEAFADVGIAEVQLVVDPITVESVEWLGGVLQVLDS
jgi:alkanesulfonate monooxygenase SsuD/methylene tetrahydromethanopterin reductase-like flavin-dependent oxidoreductase (luciferase family)